MEPLDLTGDPASLIATILRGIHADELAVLYLAEKLLLLADVCITDYSSIAFEYSILERPMLFFAYDLDDYLDERGMYLDYDEVTPGPVCRTNKELISYIKSLPEGFDREEVSAFRQKYAGMCDGHATERTIELIEN